MSSLSTRRDYRLNAKGESVSEEKIEEVNYGKILLP